MTTTEKYQVNPDYFNSVEECKSRGKDVQTNPRYSNFTQTHFTAGDIEQFEEYRDKTNGSLCNKSIDLSVNVFNQLHSTMPDSSKIGENVDWAKYHNLTTSSVDNTFNYIFYKLKKGCFVKIKDNKLAVFLPFSNAAFVNEWGSRMKQDPRFPTMTDFLMYVSKEAGYYSNPRNINPDVNTWYGNNYLVRTEWPVGEGDSDMTNLKDMLLSLCKEREIPDIEFFVNKRDFPLIKKDGTEPYDAIWDGAVPLVSHNYSTYSPILSQVTTDENADIAMPTWEDWQRVSSIEDNKIFESCRTYTDDFESIPWTSKKPIAVFRGASTGGGTTPDTNPRLKLAMMSAQNRKDSDGLPFLDAGITKWNLRPRKEPGNKYLTTIDYKRMGLGKVAPLSPLQQAQYKYIVHVDGHVSAFRLSYELGSGSVLLIADSKYRMWFRKYLIPYKHYVPVAGDLSNLYEQIRWCKEHDEECQNIVTNAKEFYKTYLSKKGILDFMQGLLVHMKEVNGTYIYSSQAPKYSLIMKEIEVIRDISSKYPNEVIGKVNPVPYDDRKSFGLYKGIQYVFNNVCANDRIAEYLVKGDRIHQSKNMSINKCSLFNTDYFLTKTLINPQKDREFIHDAFVGMTSINNLLLEIPNFVYTIGLTPDNEMVRENVKGKTLSDWMKSPEYNIDSLMSIIIQTILAIRVAQLRCGFIHYDLYPWNIIVSNLPKAVPIDFRIGPNKVYRYVTSHLVTIIDYGKSHVVHNNVHHGENIMFDMPQYQDVLTLVFSTLHELVSQNRQLDKYELNIVFNLVNSFAGTGILSTKLSGVRDLKMWLQFARKYNNILQYSKQPIGNTDPMTMVDFIHRNIAHEGKLEIVSKVEYTPYIGNERLVYDLMTKEDKAECYDDVFSRAISCELPSEGLEGLYCHQLMRRILDDSMKIMPEEWRNVYNIVIEKLDSIHQKPFDFKKVQYNRYKYPRIATRTLYDENSFSDPKMLDKLEIDMRCYVMPDYIKERDMIETIFTLRNDYLTQNVEIWYKNQLKNIIDINPFAVLHELADKGTFSFLLWSTVEADIDYIRSTVGDREDCEHSLQIASNYALILKRRQDEMTKMKI